MLRVGIAAVLLCSVPVLGGEPFESSGVALRSWLPLSSFASNPSTGNDCWGYTSSSGREYALMGLRNALAVVEVTDPDNPVIVDEIAHTSSLWGDVKVYQDHCYVSNESGGGIDVIDLSDVDNGNVTLVRRMTTGGLSTTHNVVLDEVSGFLYLCGSNLNGGRLSAYDLSDPSNPVFAGTDTTSGAVYCHDAQVVTYTSGPFSGREIAFCANPVVGLDVYDVTNKSAFVRLARVAYPNLEIAHQCWLSEDRNYLYFGDEGDETDAGLPTRTLVFDVSDVENPVYLDSFTNNTAAIDHNMYVHEGLLYQANYSTGLRVWDIENPTSPTEVAWIDTFPEDDRTDFVGAWSVFPFFASGTVVISDFNRGLIVVELDLPGLVLLEGQLAPEFVDPGASTPVSVGVDQVSDSFAPGSALLRYRSDGAGAFQSVVLMQSMSDPDVYEGQLPGAPCDRVIEYYFEAADSAGAMYTLPANAPSEVLTTQTGTVVLKQQDEMELDTGWTVGAPGDGATTGVWVRVNPVGTAAQPEDDTTEEPGTLCWVTGQGAVGGGLGTNDIDGGATTLISPVYDLAAVERPRISYDRWYSNTTGGAANADVFTVEISGDSGKSWTNVETVGPDGPGTAGGWITYAFDVSSVITPTSTMRLRFIASDFGGGSIVEAAIDGLVVNAVECETTCLADFDADGDVDLTDFGTFGAAFGSMTGDANYNAFADFDGDGDVDLTDFGSFGSLFGRTDC